MSSRGGSSSCFVERVDVAREGSIWGSLRVVGVNL